MVINLTTMRDLRRKIVTDSLVQLVGRLTLSVELHAEAGRATLEGKGNLAF